MYTRMDNNGIDGQGWMAGGKEEVYMEELERNIYRRPGDYSKADYSLEKDDIIPPFSKIIFQIIFLQNSSNNHTPPPCLISS